jgi:hypothetical protein
MRTIRTSGSHSFTTYGTSPSFSARRRRIRSREEGAVTCCAARVLGTVRFSRATCRPGVARMAVAVGFGFSRRSQVLFIHAVRWRARPHDRPELDSLGAAAEPRRSKRATSVARSCVCIARPAAGPNKGKLLKDADPCGQFAWLSAELAASRTANQTVWLVSHVFPGMLSAFSFGRLQELEHRPHHTDL